MITVLENIACLMIKHLIVFVFFSIHSKTMATKAIFSWTFDPFFTFFIDCHVYVPKGMFWGSKSRPHIRHLVMSLFFTWPRGPGHLEWELATCWSDHYSSSDERNLLLTNKCYFHNLCGRIRGMEGENTFYDQKHLVVVSHLPSYQLHNN